MAEFSLITWTVFLVTFLKYLQSSDASISKKVDIKIEKEPSLGDLKSLNAACCSNKWHILNKSGDKFILDCDRYFWNSSCYINLKSNRDVPVHKITVSKYSKKYEVQYIKSLLYLRFLYTETSKGVPWKLIVNTATNSVDVIGRIYFVINCERYQRAIIPLANNFNNFKPGRSDVFKFNAPDIIAENYCIAIFNSLHENWILTSMILTNINKAVNYTIYHGEKMFYMKYLGYKGSDAVRWIIEVTTGHTGTDTNAVITLIDNNCITKLTLDTEHDDFQPETTDVFHVQAKKCSDLQKITIRCQEYYCHWILVKINATREDGISYIFYHNETLEFEQTFFVSQVSGGFQKKDIFVVSYPKASIAFGASFVLSKTHTGAFCFVSLGRVRVRVGEVSEENEWNVSVCTNTATDREVYLKLHCSYGRTERLRLTTPKDDFQANQCSNFTLLVKNIGKLGMIELEKPSTLEVNTLTLYNNGNTYVFEPPTNPVSRLKILHYEMGVWIFSPDIKKTEQKERECAELCMNNMNCHQFYVANNTCKFDLIKHTALTIYSFRHDISVWTLDIHFPVTINEVRVTFDGWDNRLITYTSSLQTKHLSTTFSISSTFFNYARIVNVETIPTNISCADIEIHVNKTTAQQVDILNLVRTNNCIWKTINVKRYRRKTIINPKISSTALPKNTKSTISTLPANRKTTISTLPANRKTTISTLPANRKTTISTLPANRKTTISTLPANRKTTISTLPANRKTTISTLPANTKTTISTLPTKTEPIIYPSNTIQSSSVSYSNITTVEIPDEGQNRTVCKCICQKILSKEEEAEHLKKLTKELKVNRNETTSYLRSKICSPDDRVSSQVIGSTTVILMAVPFGLIVLVDLIPLLNLIYMKAVSLM